jgi:hypothetical protein
MQQRRGRTTSVERYIAQGWREDKCPECAGRGIAYSHHDRDPRLPITGMERCRCCAGRGSTWISPAGRRCEYPGGPFQGR